MEKLYNDYSASTKHELSNTIRGVNKKVSMTTPSYITAMSLHLDEK